MKITALNFNFVQTSDGQESGEDYENYTVGRKDVVSIEEHRPAIEGDKWYYDVNFADGRVERIFNPNRVFFAAVE